MVVVGTANRAVPFNAFVETSAAHDVNRTLEVEVLILSLLERCYPLHLNVEGEEDLSINGSDRCIRPIHKNGE